MIVLATVAYCRLPSPAAISRRPSPFAVAVARLRRSEPVALAIVRHPPPSQSLEDDRRDDPLLLFQDLQISVKPLYISFHLREDKKEVYLEFDGASRGNPGPAGAGAVLKSEDGAVITRVREGLGRVTNNDAEYRALIRGLKTALNMGYDVIHVKGDSKLVCKQVRGEWRVRSDKLARYCDEALELIDQFKEFNIEYFPRDQNTDADREANRAADLPEGRIFWEYNWHY